MTAAIRSIGNASRHQYEAGVRFRTWNTPDYHSPFQWAVRPPRYQKRQGIPNLRQPPTIGFSTLYLSQMHRNWRSAEVGTAFLADAQISSIIGPRVYLLETSIVGKLCKICCELIAVVEDRFADDVVNCGLRGQRPTNKRDHFLTLKFLEISPVLPIVPYAGLRLGSISTKVQWVYV